MKESRKSATNKLVDMLITCAPYGMLVDVVADLFSRNTKYIIEESLYRICLATRTG